MTEYTIAAIPTVYRGRQFRSRLEAKWAAFFDILGWEYEYEPFDLGAWSPDFLLRSCLHSAEALVEVKPLTQFSPDIATKISQAAIARGLAETIEGIFLTAAAPFVCTERLGRSRISSLCLGWVGSFEPATRGFVWAEAHLIWLPSTAEPRFVPDICHFRDDHCLEARVWWSILQRDFGIRDWRDRHYVEFSQEVWSKACNAVQWRAPT